MVEGGPIDVLTGDYLAELTMAILARHRSRDPDLGYVPTFLTQMEQVLGSVVEGGIKVVSNAGGLNPSGLARKLEELSDRLGLNPEIAVVSGDDLMPHLDASAAAGERFAHLATGQAWADSGHKALTANAYLGGWGIAAALEQGADIVITGRVTDASVVVGPAAWHFGWKRDDWDTLAAAVAVGHVLECGCQATGGNYSFLDEVDTSKPPGFPLAEMRADGSAVITKHRDTGGAVTIGTVTAQLLYEIDGPHYLNPDVTARFDTIQLAQEGTDRVTLSGVRGLPPPPTTKVGINYHGGYRNSVTFVIPAPQFDRKADLAQAALWEALGGRDQFGSVDAQRIRPAGGEPRSNEEALGHLRITVKDQDKERVGRRFSNAAVELALANYAGFMLTDPPGAARPFAVYWPTLCPSEQITQQVEVGGFIETVASAPGSAPEPAAAPPLPDEPAGPTETAPFGVAFGTRSGDKGGNANVGVWAKAEVGYSWLAHELTVERFRLLIPEAADLEVDRYLLPNLWAVNFVVKGLLGEGVAASTRLDPQAKTLGEYLRSKLVDLPTSLWA